MRKSDNSSTGEFFFFRNPDPGGEKSSAATWGNGQRLLYPGMRFTQTSSGGAALAELGNEETFSAAEISFTQLESFSVFQRQHFLESVPWIAVGELFAGALLNNVFFSSEKNIGSFTEETLEICRKLGEMNIKNIVLELPVATLLEAGEPEKELLLKFFRKLLPVLLHFDQYLLLPLRIPCTEESVSTGRICDFLRTAMNPRLKFALHIFPHELEKDTPVEEYALQSAFDAASIVFHYNRDKGDMLVKKHLSSWVTYLVQHGFNGAFLASPMCREENFTEAEVQLFSSLLHEFRSNKI